MAVRATFLMLASCFLLVIIHVDGKRDRLIFQHKCNSKYFKRDPNPLFHCAFDERMCVAGDLVCDSTRDCEDGSDEDPKFCAERHADYCNTGFKDKWIRGSPMEKWQCDDKMCIEKCRRCDGEKDCVDGSDEDVESCRDRKIKRELDAIEHQCQREVQVKRNDL